MMQKFSKLSVHRRPVRSAEPCALPEEFEHSELLCKKYPSQIICTHNCIFGHKFRGAGKQRNTTCKFSENRWTPHGITEDCEPFINCKLRVLPGGRFRCTYNFIDKPPVCDIACENYEDKAAVPSQTYHCDIKSTWTPKLPFCVEQEVKRSIY